MNRFNVKSSSPPDSLVSGDIFYVLRDTMYNT